MKVRDLPPGRLITVKPRASLADVARQMRTEDIDSVAVISDGKLAGIITERDLVEAIAQGVDPKHAEAHAIMTSDPATVAETEDITVAALRMLSLGVRHLPVVDATGNPVGLLSARNLVVALDRSPR